VVGAVACGPSRPGLAWAGQHALGGIYRWQFCVARGEHPDKNEGSLRGYPGPSVPSSRAHYYDTPRFVKSRNAPSFAEKRGMTLVQSFRPTQTG